MCRGETRAGTDDTHFGEYDINPSYPNLAPYVPLTYALTLHACLRDHHRERPTFAQVIALLEGVQQEVASGEYVDLSGAKRVRLPRNLLSCPTLPSLRSGPKVCRGTEWPDTLRAFKCCVAALVGSDGGRAATPCLLTSPTGSQNTRLRCMHAGVGGCGRELPA